MALKILFNLGIDLKLSAMRKIFTVLFIFLSATLAAQNKDYLVSTNGIGALKLGMPLTDLEKILQKKTK